MIVALPGLFFLLFLYVLQNIPTNNNDHGPSVRACAVFIYRRPFLTLLLDDITIV